MKLSSLPQVSFRKNLKPGLTLIELTVVIVVLLSLIGVFFSGSGAVTDWRKAKDASSILRDAEVAQIEFLADHPQTAPADIEMADLLLYVPGGVLAVPKDLEGNDLTIDVTQTPPILMSGTTPYDPGPPNDGLWDVGQ